MTVTTTPPPVRRERRPVATDPTPRAARRSEVLPLIAAHACVGFLLRREGAHMTVQSGDACFSARLAAGCLLQVQRLLHLPLRSQELIRLLLRTATAVPHLPPTLSSIMPRAHCLEVYIQLTLYRRAVTIL